MHDRIHEVDVCDDRRVAVGSHPAGWVSALYIRWEFKIGYSMNRTVSNVDRRTYCSPPRLGSISRATRAHVLEVSAKQTRDGPGRSL